MLRHMGLEKQDGLFRIQTGGQPVEGDLERILLHARGVCIIGSERVPIDHAEEAFVLVLHSDPVLQGTDIVAEMKLPRRAHAAEYAFAGCGAGSHFCETHALRHTIANAG